MLFRIFVTCVLGFLLVTPNVHAQPALEGSQILKGPRSYSFPHADGPFSAMLIPMSIEHLSEFGKPSDQILLLPVADTARLGDTIIFKLLFAGITLNSEGFSDVTYDLKFLNPDGSIYDVSDFKGLSAHKYYVENADNIFNNGPEMHGVNFDEDDPAGIYTIYVTIYDNVGKRRIHLTQTIELFRD